MCDNHSVVYILNGIIFNSKKWNLLSKNEIGKKFTMGKDRFRKTNIMCYVSYLYPRVEYLDLCV